MMNEGVVFESQTHLVSHMIREIESALRDVLETLVERTQSLSETSSASDAQPKPSTKIADVCVTSNGPFAQGGMPLVAMREGTSQHRKEIRVILRELGISDDDPIAKAWYGLVGKLHGKAHRVALERLRPVDEAFIHLWSDIQTLLDVVLDSFDKKYAKVYDQLDLLLIHPMPTQDHLDQLKNNLPNNLATLGYFFNRLQSPQWLVPLRKNNFFKFPPAPVLDETNKEDGTIHLPTWPASAYLARMAGSEPQIVMDIIKETRTKNGRVYENFADAALLMPPTKAAQLIPEAKVWLETSYQLLLREKLGKLAVWLSKSKQVSAAIELTRCLLLPPFSSHTEGKQKPALDVQPWIWDYHYEQFLEKGIPQLLAVSGLPTFEILCEALDQSVRLSLPTHEAPRPQDFSYHHRPAIEEHSQNGTRSRFPGCLITAVRNAAEQLTKEEPGLMPKLLEVLEGHAWNVFKRLALHLLRTAPDISLQIVAERLMDRTLFDSIDAWHEYTLLIQENFSQLTLDQQDIILSWLEPTTDSHSLEVSPVERQTWQLSQVVRLRKVLPPEWIHTHADLVASVEQYDNSDFRLYTSGGVGESDSAITTSDMINRSVPDIIKYLNAWESPSNDPLGPTREGLAQTLADVVRSDAERYTRDLTAFQRLEEPVYIDGLLRGVDEAAKSGIAMHWSEIVAFCEWEVTQSHENTGRDHQRFNREPDRGWTRQTIAKLLDSGFRSGAIPSKLRFRVWGVLERLMADLNPTPDYEAQYGGNRDPTEMSLNTVRGCTLHAIMQYALWIRKQSSALSPDTAPHKDDFDLMPEVRTLLNARLDPEQEPSITVRCVYGYHFSTLHWLDAQWATENAGRVFPEDPQYHVLREAAWETYLTYGHGFRVAFDALEKIYAYAVNEIGKQQTDEARAHRLEKQLAWHLIALYGMGRLSLDDPTGMIQIFLARAVEPVRTHAIIEMGVYLHEAEEPLPEGMLDRLKMLWAQRIKQTQTSVDHSTELATFGSWFASGKFDAHWSLQQLLKLFQVTGKAEPYHEVIKYLVQSSADYPEETVECLSLLIHSDTRGWETNTWQTEEEIILQNALHSNSPLAKQAAKDLINRLCALGYVQHRALLTPKGTLAEV